MAITAVNSVSFKNSNIGFTGNKKNENKQPQARSSTSYAKAVPLATLLAMSPLVTTNSNAADKIDTNKNNIELVESQAVNQKNKGTVVEHKFIASDDDVLFQANIYVRNIGSKASPEHMIWLKGASMSDMFFGNGGIEGKVVGLMDINYNLRGSNNYNAGNMKFRQVLIENEEDSDLLPGISVEPVVDYIESVIKNPKYKPNARMLPIKYDIQPTYSHGLETSEPDVSWMTKVKGKVVAPGRLINTATVQGTSGEWILGAYSSDSNLDNYEGVVIAKDDVRLKVDELRTVNAVFRNSHEISTDTYNQINVTDADGNKHVILDQKLFEILLSLCNDPDCNKAFKVTESDETHGILPNGMLISFSAYGY